MVEFQTSVRITCKVRIIGIVRIDDRWRVTIDEHVFASFLSEARARAAGRVEARRLHHVASEPRLRR